MKLIEAFQILQSAHARPSDPLPVFLGCGFNPLHFETLLAAELQVRFPARRVEIRTGLYGDLPGSVEILTREKPEMALVILEWPDLDPRLGIRNPSGWGPGDLPDILETSRRRMQSLQGLLQRAAGQTTIALVLPTLPLPPVPFSPGWQSSSFDFGMRESLHAMEDPARPSGVRLLSPQYLDFHSPLAGRWDVQSDLLSGFPYTLPHASALAAAAAQLLQLLPPKKGLITDLDETFWNGIVGEVGPASVSWDLNHGSQLHGLFQLLLRSLAETGVLVGVASKNDESLVRAVFNRKDLLMPGALIFPFEVHWGLKSESVARILTSWNVAADSVVFVDDSPIELAEVKSKHPAIECLLFPRDDPQGVLDLLRRLRDLFGKTTVTEEDALRRESLRTGARFREVSAASPSVAADLLREAEAQLSLSFDKGTPDPRALELVNKTNQFNLNGRRHTEVSWRSYLSSADTFLMVVSYRDKYSVLGEIAVVAGRQAPDGLRVDTWVMSCRAFSRQIEHRSLAELYSRFSVKRIFFDLTLTDRNGPLREFFREFLGAAPDGEFQLARSVFEENCPPLFHTVGESNP